MKTILIIDDYEGMRDSLKLYLQAYDMNPLPAENEEEAIKVLNNEQPDVVIMELALNPRYLTNPDSKEKRSKYIGAGLYLLKRIEKETKNKLKIIILTSFDKDLLCEDGFPEIKYGETYLHLLKGGQNHETLVSSINC